MIDGVFIFLIFFETEEHKGPLHKSIPTCGDGKLAFGGH
jgi:hypothetical protein